MENNAGPGKRYWCPRQGSISLNDQGFVVDPESETQKYFGSELASLDRLRGTKCLLLLGEPQSGKTCSIAAEVKAISKAATETGDFVRYVDLSQYSDETRLVDEVFGSVGVADWLSSGRNMYLFLDQFDTCLMNIPTLPGLTKARIMQLRGASDKLFLRISARYGLWADFLVEALNGVWGNEAVGVYEIAPMGRTEIARSADANGTASERFIESLIARELQPLAGNPLTLALLFDNFHPDSGFTKGNEWLFSECIRILCSNFDLVRHGQAKRATLSPARRAALAARAAAALVFSNRIAVALDPRAVNISDTDISLSSLEEGEESAESQMFNFTEAEMIDVLENTALFSGRGPRRIGFASRSIQEFLAARYLAVHQLSVQQIKALTQVSAAPGETVVPQLKQTVAWLGSIMPDFLRHTIRTDPKSILMGAVQDLESRFRKELVESFLSQFEAKEIADLDWGDYSQYHKLNHPEIASQLRPYIADKSRYFLVRRVAIDIAEACGVEDPGLHRVLTEVALDRSDDLHIREQAAHAISRIGNADSRLSIKVLLVAEYDEDTEDQLKGAALLALWPKHLTANELFAALTRPRRESFFGDYAMFLSSLPKMLGGEDLSLALRWAASNREFSRHDIGIYDDLAESILALAWLRLDEPQIVKDYAAAIAPRLSNFEGVKPRVVYGEEKAELPELAEGSRRALTKAIVDLLESYRPYLLVSVMTGGSLIEPEDFGWMIGELKNEKDPTKKEIWASVVHDAFRMERLDHVEAILELAPQEALIASKFAGILAPIDLHSEVAAAARASWKQMQEMEAQQAKWKERNERRLVPSVRERIERCLEVAEAGDQSGWWRLCMEMTLKNTSGTYGDEFEPDLSTLPGWSNVDEVLCSRIVAASATYIDRFDLDPTGWLSKSDVMHRPALAGVKALVLLLSRKPDAFALLSDAVWNKWVPAIVDYPVHHNRKVSDEIYPQLIARGYRAAPDALVASLLEVVAKEDVKLGHLFCLRKVRSCLDAKLQSALLDRAKLGFQGSDSLKEVLSLLIELDNFEARTYAESLLTPPAVAASAGTATAAALSLMVEAKDAGWTAVWQAILSNEEWGKALLLVLPENLRGSRGGSVSDRIGPLNTADFFLWLNEHFPFAEEENPEGAHFVTPREALSHFRNGLLSRLRDSGTPESLVALQKIAEALPDLDYLPFYVIKARENLRSRLWSPLLPRELFTLAKSPLSRIVLNSDGLIDALMESLIRLEERLQGHTPMAFVLWNQDRDQDKIQPKSEADLSDVVKDHLAHDLSRHPLVALREVEIRRAQAADGRQGERVDIYVEGMVRHTEARVSAVIEVKGDWHPQVRTAMKDQLFDRYMNETGCNRGIYLVGWFDSNKKQNRTGVKSLLEARKFFEDRAAALKTASRSVRPCVLNCVLR